MKINVLSTYLEPNPSTPEETIDNILPGGKQLSLMSNSLIASKNDIAQHVITSANLILRNAKITQIKEFDHSSLTLEILRFQRDYLENVEDGTKWIVCDPDFLFFKNMSAVFDGEFDVAMTVRDKSVMPHNSGIFIINNLEQSAYRFFKIQVELIERNFMNNSQWFGDQIVLKYIIDNSDYKAGDGVYIYEGLRIKLIDSKDFNYSPHREHPNLLSPPDVHAYHFKGRCRSYMSYFYKYYVDTETLSWVGRFYRLVDFLKLELQRKRLKRIYEASVIRRRT